ncbi:MAG: cation transporter [Bacteroidetes bacterium]|nr:cation transporter [Bacteroidota bacterium]
MEHHSHSHSHGAHHHEPLNHNKAFAIGISLNVIFIAIEIFYGIAANSMALVADAGHNFSDVLGLLLAWGAAYLAKTLPSEKRTYGLRKSTILAAFFNAVILLIAVGAILIESIHKIISPEPIGGTTMMIVAGIGFIVNGATAMLFVKGKERDINIKGAFLHMAADAGISLGVVVTGLLINITGLFILDPVISVCIVIVITYGTWSLLRDSFELSMDAVPPHIDLNEVKSYLETIQGVSEVHDLHIWAMSTTETALTVHLVIPNEQKSDKFLEELCSQLHALYNIGHATIQIEKYTHEKKCEVGNA